jgi:hypothetical protein
LAPSHANRSATPVTSERYVGWAATDDRGNPSFYSSSIVRIDTSE